MTDRNQVFMPINLRIKIADNDPVIKLAEICETLDYRKLSETYIRCWRKTDPITMFILLVLGYMTKRYSARAIEEACKTDIRFMWIFRGFPAQSDKITNIIIQNICSFVKRQKEKILVFLLSCRCLPTTIHINDIFTFSQ